MTYFKNNLNYEILNYSEEKHLFNDLQANGVAYLKNAIDIEKFYDITTDNSVNVLEYNSEHFKRLNSYISTTSFYKTFTKLGNVQLINVVARYKNCSVGTDIHVDNHTLLSMLHKVKYFMFWAPFTDISLDQGCMFFLKSKNKAFKNLLMKKSFNEKVTLAKNDVKIFYRSSDTFKKFFPEIKLTMSDIEKYEIKILTKPFKKNDLVVFNNDTYHGAFDCFNYLRRTIDFRLSINMKKIDMPELRNLKVETPQSYVNAFDNQVLDKLLY